MERYGPETYGENYADVYDDWYGEDGRMAISQIGAPDAVADGITDLADGGHVLELGVGTGRLALPPAARGPDGAGRGAPPAVSRTPGTRKLAVRAPTSISSSIFANSGSWTVSHMER